MTALFGLPENLCSVFIECADAGKKRENLSDIPFSLEVLRHMI